MMKFFLNYTKALPRNIIVISIASFFNDIASEMVYPIVPIFLTSVLGVPVATIGLIEGVSESSGNILKVFFGWISDKLQRRKPLAIAGYSLAVISRGILSFANSWHSVGAARFLDRFGKGVRSSSIDALINESCDSDKKGLAYGLHQSLDSAGAVIGPLIAMAFLTYFTDNLRIVFYLAVFPTLISVFLFCFFASEKNIEHQNNSVVTNVSKFEWHNPGRKFWIFLIAAMVASLGNSSQVFLVLKAKNIGLTNIQVIAAYVLFNLIYSLAALPAGVVADKISPRKVYIIGLGIFTIVYFWAGMITNSFWIWFLFPLYGIFKALTEGVGKAYIANLVEPQMSGTAFGIYQTSTGICLLAASLVAGFMWTYGNSKLPFLFGAEMAALSIAVLLIAHILKLDS
jgi:MFS family permease